MTILNIKSVDTYNKHFKQLKQLGYIEVFQRHENGRFSVNDYIITETPDTSEKKAVAEKKIAYGTKDEKGKFHPENIVAYAKENVKKIAKNVKKAVEEKVKNRPNKTKKTVQHKQPFFIGVNSETNEKIEIIRKNIDLNGLTKLYKTLNYNESIKLMNTAFSVMCESIKKQSNFKICGKIVEKNSVHNAIMNIDYNAFEEAVGSVREKINNGEEIRNIKGYLLSAIYNAYENVMFTQKVCV
jgi:uncharacterized protein (DUF1697 family)